MARVRSIRSTLGRCPLGRCLNAHVLALLAPFVFYLVPFVAGYGWTALSPMTPGFAGMAQAPGRQSMHPTAVEHYGTGVVVVPFQARLRAYLRDGDLPLWNPYSGLGQPFSAQGEGSPYFPAAVLRSLLPTSWSNAVTFAMIGISAVSLFGFLRLLGLSPGAAAFGGAAWTLSGVFTLHLARNNIIDQFAMIPPLFLAATWAITSGRAAAYATFALVVGLHAMAGMLQIGVNTLLLLVGFLVFFSILRGRSARGRILTIVAAFVFFGLGTALAAPYVLPIVEGVRAAYNKNVPNLAFLPMPVPNVLAFFFPLLFGQIFQSWLSGRPPAVVDWNNLYAHGSSGLLLLAVLALAALPRAPRNQRWAYLFFVGGLIFFHTRYLSMLPGSLASYLPILSQQSPKHTNGPAVFCLVVAAAFGVEWLRRVHRRGAVLAVGVTLAIVAASLLELVRRQGGPSTADRPMAELHLGLTATISLILLASLWLARRATTDAGAAMIATAAVVGECSLYLLLGQDIPAFFLPIRVGIFVVVALTGVLATRRSSLAATTGGLVAAATYAAVVIWPSSGLPQRMEVDAPPPYMVWLQQAAGHEYRAFGIFPDYSSVGEIQDIEVVGPFATNEWVAFVDLISSPMIADFHRRGSTFALGIAADLATWYNLTTDYPRARPLFDWVGVRFLVIDKQLFRAEQRTDHLALLEPSSGLRVAFEDEAVTILESPTARTKAFFTNRVREESAATTYARLRAAPSAVDEAVTVESDGADAALGDRGSPSMPVPLAEYRPNGLRVAFQAPSPGLLVVTDSFFPGWQATLNGEPTEIIRVNGLVRGVAIPAAGPYEIIMSYRPAPFTAGVAVAAATVALLTVVLALGLRRRRGHTVRGQPGP